MPVEIIIGNFFLDAYSIRGKWVIKPDEILIACEPYILHLSTDAKSPGVVKKDKPNFLATNDSL